MTTDETTDKQSTAPAGRTGTGGAPVAGTDAGPDRTFEDLMDELEAITEKLAAGDLGIEAAAELYERAEKLHNLAAERLAAVRERVERLAAPAS
jgi:exodeoxyribonuclease VII small subunit